MSDLPQKAKVVVIGGGIVGNSLVYHLALHGWKEVVQLDKGPFPNPGGSTGHASNFIFPVDHSKEMTLVTLDSVEQYKELGVFTESGGLELARTETRMEELRRRMASAKAWGIESSLLTPEEVKEMVPYVNTDIILGAFYTPSVGVVDSLRAGTLMRQKAQEMGSLTISPKTEVTGLDVVDGRIHTVHTDKGSIEAEIVMIACGVWSPRIAEMAGATIPLIPAVHQMISVGPLPLFEQTSSEIEYPIVRDMDTFCYERQNGNDMEVGSYAHRPIFMDANDIPSIEESALSPTELPFTQEDFEPQLEQALELMPEIIGDESAGIRHAINGLLSLTPDGNPLIGETEVKGLWSVAAIWIKEGPGFAKATVEWLTHGTSEIDIHGADIARYYPYAHSKTHVHGRTSEGYNKTYGIIHPREQWESNRNVRVSPFYIREKELGAVFFETAGWERPQWYESNARLLDEFGDKVKKRPHEWDARWWSPIIDAEHLALRDRGAMVDLTSFAIFDVSGPGALDYIQKMAVNQMDVAVNRAVYTPLLTPHGGFRADLTIARTGKDSFRIIDGGGDGSRDKKWFVDNLPQDGSTVTFSDMTSSLCTIGLWGPKSRAVLESLTDDDVSNEAFPYGWTKSFLLNGIPVWALRISYVGELGWEIYTNMEHGLKMWDSLWEAGRPYDIVPAGIGVYGTTGRLEKGYRLMGAELDGEYNPVEAGLARRLVKKADFIGKEAYLKARDEDPAAILCTLTVEAHMSKSGVRRYMNGREPILTPDGERIVDSKGRGSYVTSAGAGPSVGKQLLLAYLTPELAVEGTDLVVEYMNEQYPVKVAVAGSRPLFDPDNERMKG